MKIAILDLCKPDANLDHHGSCGQLIINWLTPHLAEAELTDIHVAIGKPIPALNRYDGYILSGSEKGIYDEIEWLEPLKVFLDEARVAKTPIFGICFGHQLMADTYGGKAQKANSGFEVGSREFATDDGVIAARVMHQDQVSEVPPNAKITAAASYCPVAALDYDFPAKSVQFHPEYPYEFVAEATELFDGNLMTPEEAIRSRESMQAFQVANDLCGAETAAFFRENITAS